MAYPTLNTNEIYAAMHNQIISVMGFGDNIKGTFGELASKAKVDGTLLGDTKVYRAADVLASNAWGNDAEAENLLKTYRNKNIQEQAITLDTFRQICLTTDDYMSKRAWAEEGAFSSFNGILKSLMGETKKIYDATTYNCYIGTTETAVGQQTITIDTAAAVGDATGEAAARLKAGAIGEGIAKLITNLKDATRDYNDYGYMRSYDVDDDMMFIFNSDLLAEIEKRDLPTVFHKDFIDKLGQYALPAKYFGTVNNAQKTGDGTVRAIEEMTVTKSGSPDKHIFGGELIPTGYIAPANTSYTPNAKVLCKVIHKRSVPFMSGFEVGTSFYNPKALLETNYLTWGHNTLEYLKNYPFITVKIN